MPKPPQEYGVPEDPWDGSDPHVTYVLQGGSGAGVPVADEPPVELWTSVRLLRKKKWRRGALICTVALLFVGVATLVWWDVTHPSPPDSVATIPSPVASPSEARDCIDASRWTADQNAKWLKGATDINSSLAVTFKKLSAKYQLCAGVAVSVDYWTVTAQDAGSSHASYFERFLYKVRRIDTQQFVVTGGEVLHARLASRKPESECTGKSVSVVLGGTPSLAGDRLPANPLLGFKFGPQVVAQGHIGPRRLESC